MNWDAPNGPYRIGWRVLHIHMFPRKTHVDQMAKE